MTYFHRASGSPLMGSLHVGILSSYWAFHSDRLRVWETLPASFVNSWGAI